MMAQLYSGLWTNAVITPLTYYSPLTYFLVKVENAKVAVR
jgi:hypothetical protein